MKYDIYQILNTQFGNFIKNPWKKVENEIGICFPEDYKMFIDSYGSGEINEFLWILSPFSKNENLNCINRFKVMKESYYSMKEEFPEYFLLNFFDGKNGLFPWGITENGDELFWNFIDDNIEIIVYASRYSLHEKYLMTMQEFLCKLLRKEVVCSIFPDDFILDYNYYITE